MGCTAVRTVGRKTLTGCCQMLLWFLSRFWKQVQRCISFLRSLISWPDWPAALVLMGFSQHTVRSDKWLSCDGWVSCLLRELLPLSILLPCTLIQEVAARASRCSSVTPFPWWRDANALACLSSAVIWACELTLLCSNVPRLFRKIVKPSGKGTWRDRLHWYSLPNGACGT